MKNKIIKTLTWFQQNHSLILTFATIALVFITLFYLIETRRQRLLLEKTVAVDTQPKVFIKTVETEAKPDFKNSRIIIHTKFVLSNCGKTEARNIRWSYVVSQGSQVKKEETFGPFQYLYPGQTATAGIENLRFTLPQDEMEIVKKAVELNKPIVVSGNLQKPVLLDIELVYENVDGQLVTVPYKYRYLFPMNAWVFPSQKGPES
ncbi:hypothetical protein ACFL5F_04295 [Planctomycetota bacterium]